MSAVSLGLEGSRVDVSEPRSSLTHPHHSARLAVEREKSEKRFRLATKSFPTSFRWIFMVSARGNGNESVNVRSCLERLDIQWDGSGGTRTINISSLVDAAIYTDSGTI
jgi:hypothetical protein